MDLILDTMIQNSGLSPIMFDVLDKLVDPKELEDRHQRRDRHFKPELSCIPNLFYNHESPFHRLQ